MLWLFTYFSIALLSLACDAANCEQHRRYFNFRAGLFMALLWPIFLPIGIAWCRKSTRNCRRW